MRAYVTSIGEVTTDLCVWSLERLGFEVKVLTTQITLGEKLKLIYNDTDESFLRVDADVIVNKNALLYKEFEDKTWVQFQTFDWFKMDITNGGVQYINKKALPVLRANIERFKTSDRPESQMFRLPEFHNPRVCHTVPVVAGLHGWGQKDTQRVKQIKEARQQEYDFELAEELDRCC